LLREQQATGGRYDIAGLASQIPLRLLSLLLEVHPFGRRAVENDASICFGLAGQNLVAVKDYQSGKGTIDDSETEYLQRLWERHPSLSLSSLLKCVAMIANGHGWCIWEAVLGADGVEEIVDVDDLTCYWGEPGPNRSRVIRGRPRTGYSRSSAVFQRTGNLIDREKDIELPTGPDGTFLSIAWGATAENPYGTPRLSAALSELLCDMADESDVGEWLSRVGLSQVAWSVDIENLLTYVQENAGTELIDSDGNPITLSQWLRNYIEGLSYDIEARRSGQSIVAAGATPSAITANPGTAIPQLRQQRLLRLSASLLQPPALMVGSVGSNAFSSTSDVEWEVHAEVLNSLRAFCYMVPVWIANLDLRARGVDMIARMDAEPIRAADLKAYYEAQGLRRDNEFELVRAGMRSEEDAAMSLTGSGIVNPERAIAYFAAPQPALPTPQGQP
jgi:hypothetical protein